MIYELAPCWLLYATLRMMSILLICALGTRKEWMVNDQLALKTKSQWCCIFSDVKLKDSALNKTMIVLMRLMVIVD